MQLTELTCSQCGGRYYSGKPLCPICTDAAHRKYVAALEAVAQAARGYACEHEVGFCFEELHEALTALAALDGGRDAR